MRKKWGEGRSGLLEPGFYYYYFLLFIILLIYRLFLLTDNFFINILKPCFYLLYNFLKATLDLFNMMKCFGRLDIVITYMCYYCHSSLI